MQPPARPVGPPALFGSPAGLPTLDRWTGHPDQVAGIEQVELLDGDARGVRLLRMRSGAVDLDIAVDRGFDPLRASVRGVPIGWLSPAGLRHPAYAEPSGWGPLRTFHGGLLTTCGLDHVHGPRDVPDRYGHPGIATHHHPLHGRASALPARILAARLEDGDPPRLVAEGEVRQAAPFAEQLVLTRRIELDLGGTTIRVRDRIRNHAAAPTPLAVLYHVNIGWPLLSPGAEVLAGSGEPQATAGAAAGRDPRRPGPPEPGAVESVWEHRLAPDAGGVARAAVLADDLGDGRAAGLMLSWPVAQLPHLLQWSMPAAGMYVLGLEPCTVGLGGVAAAEQDATLRLLGLGEVAELALDLTLLAGADGVAAARRACRGT